MIVRTKPGSSPAIKTSIKNIFFYVRLGMSCAVVFYLIRLIDSERLVFLIGKLKIQYAWPAFFMVLIAYLIAAARWSLLLSRFRIKQRIRDSWRYYMIGGFYSIVLPGMIGEDVVRLGLSYKLHGRSKALLATSILFERACGLVVILLMASVAGLCVPILFQGEHLHLRGIIVGVALGALFSFFFFFLTLRNSPSSWFSNQPSLSNLRRQIIALLGHIRSLSFKALFLFLLLSALAHLLDIIGTFILSRALHIDQSISIFLLIMPLVYVSAILPISIGGIGVREGILTFFLVKVGVLASDAVLLGLIIYLNRVLVGFIGGVIQFMDNKSLSMEKV